MAIDPLELEHRIKFLDAGGKIVYEINTEELQTSYLSKKVKVG